MRLTRFLRNEAVTPEAMVAAAAERTGPRGAGLHVLALQDTTVVRSRGGGGLYLHTVLAVDAAGGAILGLIHAAFLSRTEGRRGDRKARAVQDKESRRWLEGADRAAEVCAGAARVTVVADRESDIFAAFARRPAATDLLVRAAQDRALEDGGRLFAAVDALPVAGRAELRLPARPQRGLAEGLPACVAITVVDVRESAPEPGEAALHWRLLATQEASHAGEALAIADLYRRRWAIEQLFRTLKTRGFDIEGVRVEDEAPLKNLVTATLVAAVTVQQLVHARDGDPDPGRLRPLTDAFEPEDQALLRAFCQRLQGKTLRQTNPHPHGSLAYAAWVCARLGGWTGYYGKPGPIVILQGWLYFQAAKHGAAITRTQNV